MSSYYLILGRGSNQWEAVSGSGETAISRRRRDTAGDGWNVPWSLRNWDAWRGGGDVLGGYTEGPAQSPVQISPHFIFPFVIIILISFIDVVGGPTRHRDTTSAALLVSGTDMTNGCWQRCSLCFSFTHWWFCIFAFQPPCKLLFIAMQMCTRERIDLFNMFKLRKDWSFAVKRSTNSWKGKFSKLYIF